MGTHQTILMLAARFDAEQAIFKLIERNANVKAHDVANRTALHFAASAGSESSCRVLLHNGADVNSQTSLRETPLMMAVAKLRGIGHVEVVKLLLQSGADTKITDVFGRTALQLARESCADIISAHEAKKHSK